MDAALTSMPGGTSATLPPGDYFVEQHSDAVKVFSDAAGANHVADIAVVDFLDGLAQREIVFVSWG